MRKSSANPTPQLLPIEEIRKLTAKLRVLIDKAPRRQRATAQRMKRLCNALWEEFFRPPVREDLAIYTDGSHTAGKPAGWGVAIVQKHKRHLPGNGNMFSRQHLNSIAAPEDR